MLKTEIESLDAAHGASRRREVRVEPPSGITVKIAGLAGKTRIQNISYMGVCLVTDAPLVLNSAAELTFNWREISVDCRSRVAYCRKHPGGWIVGLQFSAAQKVQPWSMEDLMNHILTSAITFS